MTVIVLMERIREIVINHPDLANGEVILATHGIGHSQRAENIHLNMKGNKLVIEAEK